MFLISKATSKKLIYGWYTVLLSFSFFSTEQIGGNTNQLIKLINAGYRTASDFVVDFGFYCWMFHPALWHFVSSWSLSVCVGVWQMQDGGKQKKQRPDLPNLCWSEKCRVQNRIYFNFMQILFEFAKASTEWILLSSYIVETANRYCSCPANKNK